MSDRIDIELIDGPLPGANGEGDTDHGGGAVLSFDGVVRPNEDGRPLLALDYEAYPPMTQNELRLLSERCVDEFGLLKLTCRHSVGRVPVGSRSFRLTLVAKHRGPTLTAMAWWIDRMKRDVPLWKVPVFADDAGLEATTRMSHPRNTDG